MLSGSDVHLAWVRRTRLGGDLLGGTGTVPINEQSEAYEVDILSGVGGTVKRTLAGLTSAAAVYTAAEITADFGTPPAKDILYSLPSRRTQTSRFSDSALTTDTPTPCRPPEKR